MNNEPAVIGLMATLPCRRESRRDAVASMATQSRRLDALVLVIDSDAADPELQPELANVMAVTPVHVLANAAMPGAAGSWNTGISFVAAHWPGRSYVAMLDDDDAWDADHVQTCMEHARAHAWSDVVVSGLRMVKAGVEIPRPPVSRLAVCDFLTGNPGWQGSNTFIRLDTLLEAGGFTEGLASCNDRDLAVRVLSLNAVRTACTGRHTATWHLDGGQGQLSRRRGAAKRNGLARFFDLHGHHMDAAQRARFFTRAQDLFDWSEQEILGVQQGSRRG